jgi:hypothetical protein
MSYEFLTVRMLEEEVRTLNLSLDIVDSVRRLHLEGDSLAREGLHENLHGDLENVSRGSNEESLTGHTTSAVPSVVRL